MRQRGGAEGEGIEGRVGGSRMDFGQEALCALAGLPGDGLEQRGTVEDQSRITGGPAGPLQPTVRGDLSPFPEGMAEDPVVRQLVGEGVGRAVLTIVVIDDPLPFGVGIVGIDDHEAGREVDHNSPGIVTAVAQTWFEPQVVTVSQVGLGKPAKCQFEFFQGFGVGRQGGNRPIGLAAMNRSRPVTVPLPHHQLHFTHVHTVAF